MNLDRIALTLYDVVGYLLPGYVVLLASSIAEATFFGTWFLSLSLFSAYAVPFAIAAYFLGQACHAVASWLTEHQQLRHVLQARRERMLEDLNAALLKELQSAFGAMTATKKGTSLETYLLADAYLVAAGRGPDRDLLMAREGFFKQSIVAFVVLALTCFLAAASGGATIQTRPGTLTSLPAVATVGLAVVGAIIAALFRLRFGFHHRVKMNDTMLLSLAVRAQDRARGGGRVE